MTTVMEKVRGVAITIIKGMGAMAAIAMITGTGNPIPMLDLSTSRRQCITGQYHRLASI